MTRQRAQELVEPALKGNWRALARLLSEVEDGGPGAAEALAALYPLTGKAHLIGLTGAPGTGKSTLVSALTRHLRERGERIAVLAVDPTSPFSGGAILGDRIRMRELSGDAGVFIRSMATRGTLGGLAAATLDCARVLDAAGFDRVIIETVGAGQNEVAIARAAQTTLVVDAPGLGDEVQAIKAGILEIADILVVNKADRPGAAHTVRALRMVVETGHNASRARWLHHGQWIEEELPAQASDGPMWVPPIIETVASEGKGVEALADQIDAHRAFLQQSALSPSIERAQLAMEIHERLRELALEQVLARLPAGSFEDAVERVRAREQDPSSAADALFTRALFGAVT